MKTNYSIFTLTPKDEDDRKLFWNFRVNEMLNQYRIYTILLAAAWAFTGISALVAPTKTNKLNFLRISVILTLLTLTLFASKRWSDAFVYLTPVNYLIIFSVTILTMQDLGIEWDFEKHL